MKRIGFFAATTIVAASLTAVGAGTAAAAPQVDPLTPGPHKVAEASYHLGDDAFRPDAFPWPVEVTGHVYYPEKPAVSAYPVVVFLHGRHATCMSSTVPAPRLAWPCPAGYQPIPSHRGYDYLGRQLAGHGYAVISISANGINGNDALDANYGQRARGELVLKHLDLWNEWRTKPGGPVPVSVTRSFDFDRIGLMGHSRGGEGVVNAVEQNALRERPYRLRALLPLAATDFERRIPVGITMATLQPDCDGDVSDLQGVHYYDDGRYYVRTDRATRNNVTVLGANHNFFNTNWSPSSGLPGAVDDWRGGQGDPNSSCHPGKPTRLTEQQQRNVGIAYINGFFRHYLGGEKALAPLWRGAAGPPASVAPATVNVSYHPPSASGQRLDVNRQDGYRDVNTLGGKVVATGVKQIACGGPNPGEFASCLSKPGTRTSEPHRGWGRSGVLAARTTWAATGGTVTNEVPAPHGDVRKYAAVQFRAGVDFSDPANAAGQPQDLRIVLTDAAGRSASVKASEHGKALAYPPQGGQNDVLPRMHLNQVRVPLTAFAGVDLTKITSVALALDVNPTGALAVSDLVFTD